MDLKELYMMTEGSYEEAMMRFIKEDRLKKFLGMFLNDPSFSELQAAIAENKWDIAFRAVHTLKGVAGNMAFTRLRASVSDLTEAIRDGKALEDYSLYDTVCENYNKVVNIVKTYLAENT